MQWLCYYALRRKRHDFGSQLLFRQICYGKIEKRNHTPDSTRLDREGITHFLVCAHFLLLGVSPEWELSPPLFLLFVHEVRSQNLLGICFSVAWTAKELISMCEIRIWFLGREDPRRRAWQPSPVFLPGERHGRRSLVGYILGITEVDMTEQQWRDNLLWGRPELR